MGLKGLNGHILLKATPMSAEEGVAIAAEEDKSRGIKIGDNLIFPPGDYYSFMADDTLYLALPVTLLVAVVPGSA